MRFPPARPGESHRDTVGAVPAAGSLPARDRFVQFVQTLTASRKALAAGLLAALGVAGAVLGLVLSSGPGLAAAAAGTAGGAPGTGPQLHVAGNQLVTAAGQPVVLHGADRSGTEFMCVHDKGIFDGPVSQASINVMKAHGINAVRVPLNEACWNGDSYVNPAYSGAHYRAAVTGYIHRLTASGLATIIDLHWTDGAYTGPASACVDATATCQKPMPDAAGAPRFWKSVAGTFKGSDAVIFDLFNEPYPEQAAHGSTAQGWTCWLHGGTCPGISYPVAGMQTMLNAVRSAGAANIVMAGGLTWSNDLTGWLAHQPADPDHNLAASWHSYNFNACSTQTCWNHQIAPVAAKVPLIAGEIGENDCTAKYITPLTQWMDTKHASYLAWTWNADFNCASGPGLITNYNGQPTTFGAGYETHIHPPTIHAITAQTPHHN